MTIPANEYQVLHDKVEDLDERLKNVEEKIRKNEIPQALVAADVAKLREDFADLKNDVALQLKSFTDKTWKLIFALLIIMSALMGIKSIPFEKLIGG
jgi:predicted nuclease with TOPRIM domain